MGRGAGEAARIARSSDVTHRPFRSRQANSSRGQWHGRHARNDDLFRPTRLTPVGRNDCRRAPPLGRGAEKTKQWVPWIPEYEKRIRDLQSGKQPR
jgi:hypothetical protein